VGGRPRISIQEAYVARPLSGDLLRWCLRAVELARCRDRGVTSCRNRGSPSVNPRAMSSNSRWIGGGLLVIGMWVTTDRWDWVGVGDTEGFGVL
jgi:hypothetical protein